MNIIKEYTPQGRIILRTCTYAHSLLHFNTLFNEARKDFPDLALESVEVVQFGGMYYKRTWGIEFDLPPEASCPESYSEIQEPELTF